MAAAPTTRPTGRLTVLMATWNGARFLDSQLESIAAQDWPEIDIVVSDDGSTDGTLGLLASRAASWSKGRFEVIAGPRTGFANNFRHLMARNYPDADYVAFSDQDDLWAAGKCRVAIAQLAASGDRPALFCSRTEIVDEAGRSLGFSPDFRRPPSFANALVQSIAGGNTMVLNRSGFRLVSEVARRTGFVSHDWFCYLLVSGAGGDMTFSLLPLVRYRQHKENLIGANTGFQARMERLGAAWGGRFTRWNRANLATMEAAADLLTEDARRAMELFRAARTAPLPQRLGLLHRSGVYRQTRGGQLSLIAAALLGKL